MPITNTQNIASEQVAKLERIRKRISQLEAREQAILARKSRQQRADETRRSIVLGKRLEGLAQHDKRARTMVEILLTDLEGQFQYLFPRKVARRLASKQERKRMKIEYVIADREGWYELILHCNSESGLLSLSLKLPRAGRMISTHDDDDAAMLLDVLLAHPEEGSQYRNDSFLLQRNYDRVEARLDEVYFPTYPYDLFALMESPFAGDWEPRFSKQDSYEYIGSLPPYKFMELSSKTEAALLHIRASGQDGELGRTALGQRCARYPRVGRQPRSSEDADAIVQREIADLTAS